MFNPSKTADVRAVKREETLIVQKLGQLRKRYGKEYKTIDNFNYKHL